MPFLIIFGIILSIIGFVIKQTNLKEVDRTLCKPLQIEQENDIRQNKQSSKILLIVGPILAVVGIIGTCLL